MRAGELSAKAGDSRSGGHDAVGETASEPLANAEVVIELTIEAMANLDVQELGKKKMVKCKARKPVLRKWMGKQAERLRPLDLGDTGLDETSESSVEVGKVGELGASAVVEPEGLVGHSRQPAPRGGSMPGRKARPDYKQTRSSKRRWRHARGQVGR